MVRRIVVGSTLTLAASTALALAPVAAGAATQYQVSGSLLEVGPDSILSVNPTPGLPFVGTDVHPVIFSGGLNGTAMSTEHTVERADGSFETRNIESFDNVTVTANDGTVIGSGRLVIDFNATGYLTFDSSFNITGGTFTGVWQIVSAGGGLAGLQGSGTSSGVPGTFTGYGTYTGSVH